jgi:hypothetical protein
MERLLNAGRIEENIHFAPEPDARFTYALEQAASKQEISTRYRAQEDIVVLSTEKCQRMG